MPDYTDLLQEFIWQFDDCQPYFPRTRRHLDHWDQNIEAKIQEAFISYAIMGKYTTRNIKEIIK